MKVVHSSDWHLGQMLHGHSREAEQQAFLAWLLELLASREVDALLIAGDIFHSGNPPPWALTLYYDFLASVHRSLPGLQVVIIGGNHDSPARLDAPDRLFRALGIVVRGRYTRDPAECVVPLRDAQGELAAIVLAVPYLRPADLFLPEPAEAVRAIYAQTLEQATLSEDVATIAMGHLHLVGGELSELSERKILSGGEQGLPLYVFPAELSYVALGHLHLAQSVGESGRVHYSGAPYALSMGEAHYPHQVRMLTFQGAELREQEVIAVPKARSLMHVPSKGPGTVDEVLEQLEEAAFASAEEPPQGWPFLEVRVRLQAPEPDLRERIIAALEGKGVHLVRVAAHVQADEHDSEPTTAELSQLEPRAVFELRHRAQYGEPPDEELSKAFDELVADVLADEETAADAD